jgi:hypothetical protein
LSSCDNRALIAGAQRELGWWPQAMYGLLEDIAKGSYSELAKQLRQKSRVAQ